MIRAIAKHPDPILRVKTTDMTTEELASQEIQDLIDDMIETMYAAQGIGIAAPQVSQEKRICIVGKEADESLTHDLVLVNPQWQKVSKKKQKDPLEACLSIPNTNGVVLRWKDIEVAALDRTGQPIQFTAHDYFARVVQHEVDHLNGVLFIDKATDIQTYDDTDLL